MLKVALRTERDESPILPVMKAEALFCDPRIQSSQFLASTPLIKCFPLKTIIDRLCLKNIYYHWLLMEIAVRKGEIVLDLNHKITMKTKRKFFYLLKEIAIGVILFIIVLIPFLSNLESQRFHADENEWLHSTKYFKLFFIDRDFGNRQWKDWLAFDNPPVGRYILGFALLLGGYGGRIEELANMDLWDFARDYKWNVSHGRMPPKELLLVGRFSMAIMGSLACLLLYCIGKVILNRRVGIMTAILLAFNPLMLLCGQRAMTDTPLIFFLTANILLITFFYNAFLKGKIRKAFFLAGLIGLNIALSTGTKLNGGIAAIVFAAFCIYLIIIKVWQYRSSKDVFPGTFAMLKKDHQVKMILTSLLIAIFISLSVFVGLNPYLYQRPLKGQAVMLYHRMQVVKGQQKGFGSAITSISQKVQFVIQRTLIPGNYATLSSIFKIPIDFILFLIGLFLLTYEEGKHLLKDTRPTYYSVLILWVILTFVLIVAWIPLDWGRYYLPVVPCVVMVTGYGIDRMIGKSSLILRRIHFLQETHNSKV